MIIDFHTHSLASDGALSPTELLAQARAAGVSRFAITDHDTTAGYLEVRNSEDARAVGLVSGVELSCRWATSTIHVVGLNFDVGAPSLITLLQTLTHARTERAEKIAHRLGKAGFAGALEGAREIAQDSQIGRPHFASWLIAAGHVATANEAFDRYLGAGKLGDVQLYWPPLSEVVGVINEAGGTAILAHPLKYKLTGMKLRALLNDFKTAGGAALEVLNGRQPAPDMKRLSQLAAPLDLLLSAGSDFHRSFEYGAPLGIQVDRLIAGNYVWDALEVRA